MRLYPAIVTLHLLGGLALLALLAIQAEVYEPRRLALSPALRRGLWAVAGLAVLQIALGGWVSTNYAVLACSEFPTCQGSWWPEMSFGDAFQLRRPLGGDGDGGFLPFAALTAIHMAHRLGALVLLPALLLLAWRLVASGDGRCPAVGVRPRRHRRLADRERPRQRAARLAAGRGGRAHRRRGGAGGRPHLPDRPRARPATPSRQWPGRAVRDPWLRRMNTLAIPALPLALAALP